MRPYPVDSPQAAARLVALAIVADGHVSMEEIDALDRHDAYATLGLDGPAVQRVLQDLCEDMLQNLRTPWADACVIDEPLLDSLLDEVRDRRLRADVLRLCEAVATADHHLSHGESMILARALERWGFAPPAPLREAA